jgi:YD repeat-containing protein
LGTTAVNPTNGVYLFSGEFRETVVDLRIPGRGLDFIWARTYRSRTGPNTAMGNGWDYSCNIRIEQCGPDLIVCGGNGRRDLYILQPDGTWAADGFCRELTQNPDDSFTLTFPDTGTWTLLPLDDSDARGKISTIADRNGNTMGFEYDPSGLLTTITDTLGHKITISYSRLSHFC